MRVLVTGSRKWTNEGVILDAINHLFVDKPINPFQEQITFVHGAAPGADKIIDDLCRLWPAVIAEPHPADWEKFGKAAGPNRNQEMVDAGADICLAFPGPKSKGTWDCIRRAQAAGIPVKIYDENGGTIKA